MSKFDYCLFIGRFQPFHNGHYEVLKHALSIADKAILVIGSANQTPNARNPWTADEREAMIRAALSDHENLNTIIIHLDDFYSDGKYDDVAWKNSLHDQISQIINTWSSVALTGTDYDSSSYYLHSFPGWSLNLVPNIDKFPHATELRYQIFHSSVKYLDFVPAPVGEYIKSWIQTDIFNTIKVLHNICR